MREPCAVCGSVNRLYDVELVPSTVAASFLTSSPLLLGRTRAVLSDLPDGSRLHEVGFLLKWDELTENGAWLLRVYRGNEFVDAAVASDKREALRAVGEALLP
jgi:hypothetical protein